MQRSFVSEITESSTVMAVNYARLGVAIILAAT
jgi:hypothetical protein